MNVDLIIEIVSC